MPLCNTVAVTLSILCISPCSTNQCQMGKIVVKPFLRMTTDGSSDVVSYTICLIFIVLINLTDNGPSVLRSFETRIL